ncbi:4-hydroxybenzoyl-CoA reductase subunit beta [Pseudopelagicola sp. nBUS_20]|uniref:4-hydroxybenzoyl-CoA reductase subunit beta n=1 Tax=Pseudopelagicola sp. nBUS_20 TaxID=3395317 RepID=UPI003EBB59F5
MTEALPQFTLVRPETLDDALIALQATPDAALSAGGTDLIVRLRKSLVGSDTLIDLTGIKALNSIDPNENGLRIGAGVTLDQIEHSDLIAQTYPAVVKAAASVAGPSHRQVATLGGNLCLDTRCVYLNQSHWWRKANDFCLKYQGDTCHVAPKGNRCRAAFSGDLAPALLVHDAEVEIAGPTGLRREPLGDLYVEDGATHLTLEPGEILVAVNLPASNRTSDYEKIRVRKTVDFPLAGVAVACDTSQEPPRLLVAVTGTNSRPFLIDPPDDPMLPPADEAFFLALQKQVQKAVSPQRTTMIAPHYRRLSVAALAVRLARRIL